MSQGWCKFVILATWDAGAGVLQAYGQLGLELVKDRPGRFIETLSENERWV